MIDRRDNELRDVVQMLDRTLSVRRYCDKCCELERAARRAAELLRELRIERHAEIDREARK